MEDREYIKKKQKFCIILFWMMKKWKQIYARIFNNIKDIVKYKIVGLEYLDISISEIKDIIKDVVNKY